MPFLIVSTVQLPQIHYLTLLSADSYVTILKTDLGKAFDFLGGSPETSALGLCVGVACL